MISTLEQMNTEHRAAREKLINEANEWAKSNQKSWANEIRIAMEDLNNWKPHRDDLYEFCYPLRITSSFFDYGDQHNIFASADLILKSINDEFKARGDSIVISSWLSSHGGPDMTIHLGLRAKLNKDQQNKSKQLSKRNLKKKD